MRICLLIPVARGGAQEAECSPGDRSLVSPYSNNRIVGLSLFGVGMEIKIFHEFQRPFLQAPLDLTSHKLPLPSTEHTQGRGFVNGGSYSFPQAFRCPIHSLKHARVSPRTIKNINRHRHHTNPKSDAFITNTSDMGKNYVLVTNCVRFLCDLPHRLAAHDGLYQYFFLVLRVMVCCCVLGFFFIKPLASFLLNLSMNLSPPVVAYIFSAGLFTSNCYGFFSLHRQQPKENYPLMVK